MLSEPAYTKVGVCQEESLPPGMPYSPSMPDLESKSLPPRPQRARSAFNYKPTILRTLSLTTCLLVTLLCIGLLEYALAKLPHAIPTRKAAISKRGLTSPDIRQVSSSTLSQTGIAFAGVTAAGSATIEQGAIGTATPRPVSPAPAPANPGNFIGIDNTRTLTLPPASAASGNFFNTDATTLSVASGAFINTDNTRIIASSAISGAFIQTDKTITPVYSAPPTVYVPTDTTISSSGLPSQTGLTTTTSATVVWIPVPQSPSETTLLNTVTAKGLTTVQTLRSMITPAPQSTQSTSFVVVTASIPQPQEDPNNASESKVIIYKWTNVDVFAGMYLAILVALFYRIVWRLIYNNFTLIEPFRQMAKPKGALAEHAFFAFYLSQSNLFGPIPSITNRRWILAAVATAYLIACILPGLAVEAIFTDTNWACEQPDLSQVNNPCPARISAHVTVIRIIEALLAFAAFVICAMIICLLRSSTGLPANPSSMATVASLMGNHELADDLSSIPANATTDEMRKLLKGRRYHINYYKGDSGDVNYGIIPLSNSDNPPLKQDYHHISPTSAALHKNHRAWITDFTLILLVLGLFAVVLAYYLDYSTNGFNTFFSSNTFGPKFLLTTTASITASMWKSVEQSTLITSPYARLAAHPSPATPTILYPLSNTPLLATYRAFRNGYPFAAFISLVALLGEVLTVSIAAVAYGTGQTWMQYLTSAYMSIGVLSVMILALGMVMVRRRGEPRIPRRPDLLGPVMGYLVGSERVMADFEGVSLMGVGDRDAVIRGLGRRYVFREVDGRGWRVDVVGRRRSWEV